jgi:nitronate monooxygenase
VPTAFTDLVGCSLPLQQAGMGGVTSLELAAAVAGAGALGMIALHGEPPERVAAALDELSKLTDGVYGINFLMPFVHPSAVEAAASRSRVVEFFYGDPDPRLIELVHGGGALACWQVGSVDEASAAADAGCDLLVAQGNEAGGHVRGTLGLRALLEAVVARSDRPILAAGGVGTAEQVVDLLDAGAAGVRVGTRFVAAIESNAHPDYVDALIHAHGGDTVITELFSVGWPDAPHRVLRSCITAAQSLAPPVAAETIEGSNRHQIPRYSPETPCRGTRGHVAAMALYAGEGVGAVTKVDAAADIVRELTRLVASR